MSDTASISEQWNLCLRLLFIVRSSINASINCLLEIYVLATKIKLLDLVLMPKNILIMHNRGSADKSVEWSAHFRFVCVPPEPALGI